MNYEKQINVLKDYIEKGEKKRSEFKLGVEFEHFVIDKDTLKTISYYGEDGVTETLKDLESLGYKGV